MTDTAELIAELLAEVRSDGDVIAGPSNLDFRAATTIASLVRERDEARKVLRDHHKWHAESGVLGIPDGDGGWIEMDNGAEYADSRLCQRTEAAISGMSPEVVVPPRGGWSMGSNHWENWQLAYRHKRAAEARATAAEAERDEAQRNYEALRQWWDLNPSLIEHRLAAAEADAARMREALEPFAKVADMEERAEPFASVMVNVDRCRDARALLLSLKDNANG